MSSGSSIICNGLCLKSFKDEGKSGHGHDLPVKSNDVSTLW